MRSAFRPVRPTWLVANFACSALALALLTGLVIPRAAGAGSESLPLVSPIFGDHMVLQRGQPNRIWGWAKPGTEIRVTLASQEATAIAGLDRRWQVEILPPLAGGPYVLRIASPRPARPLELRDVLVGDLWVCGGQSNMAFGLASSRDGPAAVQNSTNPGLRLFRVTQQCTYAPATVPQGEWQLCNPEAFNRPGGFSAVAYHFGRKIHQATGVPIGLIQDCVGGSPAESWMSPDTLRRLPDFAPALAEIHRLKSRGGPEYGNYVMHWFDEFDRGLQGGSWAAVAHDDSTWQAVSLKRGFAQLGVPDTPAVCWFRREIVLPDNLPAGAATLRLGVVEKMDTTFVNGRWVGASSWVENPRAYSLAPGVLHPGRNLLAIRVLKLKPNGGFQSDAGDLRLVVGDGTSLPLEGKWKGAVSVDAQPPHPLPLGYENYPTMPAVLYLGMLEPLAPLAITGALWYQGEANFTRARQYHTLLPAVISDWRTLFARRDLPFYIVSLPAFMARREQPGSDGWAEIREAQAATVRRVPHTALAVMVDTGDADNIHPLDKQPVGERLALCALKQTYGADVVCDGPSFASMETLPGRLRLHFDHTDGGLVMRGERLGEFAVAGADHVWHWADATLDGNDVVVSSPSVSSPVAARYAWQANPLATLFNGAGLPAVPFRTDDWPLSGDPKK